MKNYDNLTAEQKKAVLFKKGNALVSASAGSGKTFVVIERIIRLVTEENVGIDRILAVTFTNLAAAEMKEKLKTALTKEYNETGEARFKAELDKLPLASISTLHAFCSDLLRKYFYAAGVDAAFEVLDEKKSEKLKTEAMTSLFESLYESNDEDFTALLSVFSSKRSDRKLRSVIEGVYKYAESESGLDALMEKSVNSHMRAAEILNEEFLPSVRETAEKYFEIFKKLGTATPDEDRKKYCEKLCVLTEEMQNSSDLFDFSAAYTGVDLTVPRKKPINFAVAEEIKSEATEFKKYLSALFSTFSESREEADKKAKDNISLIKSIFSVATKFDEEYSRLKAEENGVDFTDLQRFALRLLKNAEIREEVKSKFDYVFVDEYQDVNAEQEELINLLSDDNAFLVGDSKQSIYAFRGCDPRFFIDKYSRYLRGEGGSAISLDCNFRSAPEIIKTVNSVFNEVFIKKFGGFDYANNQMVYGGGYENFEGKACIHLIKREENSEEETNKIPEGVYSVIDNYERDYRKPYGAQEVLIVKLVAGILGTEWYDIKEKDESARLKKAGFGDICILLRSNSGFSESLASALGDAGIPVTACGKKSVTVYPEIKAMINAVNAITSFESDVSVASLMLNFYGFDETELLKIRKAKNGECSFTECVYSAARSGGDSGNKVAAFIERFKRVRLISEYAPASEVLYYLISDTGFDVRLAASEFGANKLKRVKRFIAEADTIGKNVSVRDFSEYLKDGSSDITFSEAAGDDTVKILTEHASKGLEFPVVIVADTGRRFNSADVKGDILKDRKYGIIPKNFDLSEMTVSENALRAAVKQKYGKERAIEEARLFYVALTRAKCALHIVGNYEDIPKKHNYDDFSTAISQKGFVAQCDAETVVHNEKDLVFGFENEGAHVYGKRESKELTEKIKKNLSFVYPYEKDTVMPVKVSVSNVNAGEEEYYKVTSLFGKSDAETGTLYHKFLQNCDFKEDPLKEKKRLLADGVLTYNEYLKLDEDKLISIMKMDIFKEVKDLNLFKEQKFCVFISPSELGYEGADGNILVQGIADLIAEKENGEIILADYKFSSLINEADLVSKYKKQLYLYKTAIEKVMNKKVVKTCLVNILQMKTTEIDFGGAERE